MFLPCLSSALQLKLLQARTSSDLKLHHSAITAPGTEYVTNFQQENLRASWKPYYLPVLQMKILAPLSFFTT